MGYLFLWKVALWDYKCLCKFLESDGYLFSRSNQSICSGLSRWCHCFQQVKSHEKSVIIKDGSSTMDFFIESEDWLSWDPQWYCTSFFIKFCNGLTISEKLGMNLLTKFIWPRKDCIDFLEEGGGSLEMTWVLSGSMIIPSLNTMNPRSFPCSTTKTDLLGFRDMSYLQHHSRTTLRWDKWAFLFLEKTVSSSR